MATVPNAADNPPALFGESQPIVISNRQRDLLDAATAIEMEDAREVGRRRVRRPALGAAVTALQRSRRHQPLDPSQRLTDPAGEPRYDRPQRS